MAPGPHRPAGEPCLDYGETWCCTWLSSSARQSRRWSEPDVTSGRGRPGEDSGQRIVVGCREGLAAKVSGLSCFSRGVFLLSSSLTSCPVLFFLFSQMQVTKEKAATERPVTARRDGRARPARRKRNPRGNVQSEDEGDRDEEVYREEKGPGVEGGEGSD